MRVESREYLYEGCEEGLTRDIEHGFITGVRGCGDRRAYTQPHPPRVRPQGRVVYPCVIKVILWSVVIWGWGGWSVRYTATWWINNRLITHKLNTPSIYYPMDDIYYHSFITTNTYIVCCVSILLLFWVEDYYSCYSILLNTCYSILLHTCYSILLNTCYSILLSPCYAILLTPCYGFLLWSIQFLGTFFLKEHLPLVFSTVF